MRKLKLDLTQLAVQAFATAPNPTLYSFGNSHDPLICPQYAKSDDRSCEVCAHQNDTMPDPDAPDRATQKEQQRDPDLQSYTTGGGGGAASDPDQNLIIEDDPRFEKPADEPKSL